MGVVNFRDWESKFYPDEPSSSPVNQFSMSDFAPTPSLIKLSCR